VLRDLYRGSNGLARLNLKPVLPIIEIIANLQWAEIQGHHRAGYERLCLSADQTGQRFGERCW
jgi:hypothetical protein